jgi:phenylalanyl-tRNA synthetase beta chain
LSGVVVGVVEKCEPLAGSDNLRVCTVNAGNGPARQVLCGAPNVRRGGRYPYAQPGAVLPGDRRIEPAVIRGMQSTGMLCSADELGLAEAAEGLLELDADLKPGSDLIAALALDDSVLEISITPNRGDCMSIAGLAREAGVLNRMDVAGPGFTPVPATTTRRRGVQLAVPGACPRYVGRIIDGVDLTRSAPLWMRERLRRAGVRSINVAVDITNYVMLELGQPMHAFDNEKLRGDVVVRHASAGERLTFLDDQERELAPDMLAITDASGIIAMGGVMGGMSASITTVTRSIFLESAFFPPAAIMGRARRVGLQTDAAQRYERGVDPELQVRAMERATALVLSCCGGQAGPTVDTCDRAALPKAQPITLRHARVNRLIGVDVPAEAITDILRRLGFNIIAVAGNWQVTAPPFRFDIALEADLIEEVARIHGYGRIPSSNLGGRVGMHQDGPDPRIRDWRRVLVERGYLEAITFSFTDAGYQDLILGAGDSLPLRNPIASDLSVMRRGLLPGLLGAVAFNLKRQQTRVRLFELGRAFRLEDGKITQPLLLAGVNFGNNYPEQWNIKNISSDFYDVKSDVEALLATAGINIGLRWQPHGGAGLHPGQNADIAYKDQIIGYVSSVHPRVLQALDLPGPMLAFELDVGLIPPRVTAQYQPVSRFPSLRRDLAIVVDQDLPVQRVLDAAAAAAGEALTNLELFDVYQGEGIDLGKKSLAIGLIFQMTSSTLTDEAVDSVINSVLSALREEFGGTLRE